MTDKKAPNIKRESKKESDKASKTGNAGRTEKSSRIAAVSAGASSTKSKASLAAVSADSSFNAENSPSPLPLTAKEKSILEFIESFQLSAGICPSYQEIKDHFGFASFNSVQNYLKQLITKGYLRVPSNQKRAIQILHSASAVPSRLALAQASGPASFGAVASGTASRMTSKKDISAGPPYSPLLQSNGEVLSLPLLGKVAAGQPLESLNHDEFIKIPAEMVRHGSSTFALKVQGDSMINEGIFNGDTVLVQQQSHAKNGDIVVASVDNEATIKRFYLHTEPNRAKVELRPANDQLESMWFSPEQIQIQGILVGLLRKF
jgi:repressor LexA